jgi:hypothetical protein
MVEALRPFLLPLLGNEMPKHGIHPPLIAGATIPIIVIPRLDRGTR